MLSFSIFRFPYIMELTENDNFQLFAANGKQNGKHHLFSANGKRKTEVCFPWLVNDKQ